LGQNELLTRVVAFFAFSAEEIILFIFDMGCQKLINSKNAESDITISDITQSGNHKLPPKEKNDNNQYSTNLETNIC
jgi:hypothetical protein